MSSRVNRTHAEPAAKKTVGFKFPDERLREAFVRLAASRGKSPGQLARDICVEALRNETGSAVPSPNISDELGDIRRAMAESIQVLLISAGTQSQQAAERWVRKTWTPSDRGGAR